MALSKEQLTQRIIAEMQAQGARLEGEHAWLRRMATAISNAVVDEIQQNAEAITSGGNGTVQ